MVSQNKLRTPCLYTLNIRVKVPVSMTMRYPEYIPPYVLAEHDTQNELLLKRN